ncbi:MAG: hypothetical protein E6Q36_01310 [Chryseobacterium sp.]|nr:MAG: hypothetical protein E6Q36_01310 [Chryseobacterium sp.]
MNFTHGFVASTPVCKYKPRPGTHAEKILNYILANRGCSHAAVLRHFNAIGIMSGADGQIRQVVASMIHHGHENLIPSGYTDYFLQKCGAKKKTQNTVPQQAEISFEDMLFAKKIMKKFGGIARFKEVCEALEMLAAA